MTESDPCFAKIVRCHFDVYYVPHADSDEVLSHFAGDMSKHFMSIRQNDPEHRSRQDLGDPTRNYNWLLFSHAI